MSRPGAGRPGRWLSGLFAGGGLRAQLLRGGMGSAALQALNRVLALALGIVLARALGTDGYGIYAYAFAVMTLLMVAAEAGVPQLLMREVAGSQGAEHWGLLRGVLVRGGQFVLLTSTAVSVAGLAVLGGMAPRLTDPELYTALLMLLALPLVALLKIVVHALRGLHRVVAGLAVDLLLRPLLALAVVTALFLLAPDLRQPHYAMAAQLVAASGALLVGVWLLGRYFPSQARARPAEYRSRLWLRSALPFTLIGGAGIINSQADILMLGWFTTASDVGVYRVVVQGALLVAFVLNALNMVLAPNYARLHAQGQRERMQRLATTSARIVLVLTFPIALTFILFGEPILALVFGPAYGQGHVALAILGGGRPSADDMLLEVASTDGTYYGRIDPVHYLKADLDERTRPFRKYVPTLLRVGMGVAFVYLGLIQKLADPGTGLLVVEKYDLTAVVPVDPGLWVVGAGVPEIAVGLALIAGFFTRGAAAASFVLFTTTLFGLPDDPVVAHISLFGLVSALLITGGGPYSVDAWLEDRIRTASEVAKRAVGPTGSGPESAEETVTDD
jgi:O-antigen/teichoic acid export membrane protein/uncharacterized membrane protein YphA (DoxX/SURF4 family)